MQEIVTSILFILVVLALVVVLPLAVLWKLRKKRNTKHAAECAAADQAHEKELRAPDHAGFEARYGCPVPPVLLQFYENSSGSHLEGDFEIKLETFPKPFFVA